MSVILEDLAASVDALSKERVGVGVTEVLCSREGAHKVVS